MITSAKLNRAKTIVTTTLIVLIAFPLPAFAHSTDGPGHKTGGIGHTPCNDGVVVLSPNTLWPPNHKLVTVDVAYIDNDNDADAVSLAINSISSNQDSPDGTPDCGNQNERGNSPRCDQNEQGDNPKCENAPDWIFAPTPVTATDPSSAATTVQLRAARCGGEGSRVYTINVTCTHGAPESSPSGSETVDLAVTVQHAQGHQ